MWNLLKRFRSKCAFTLPEVAAVVAVTGTLAAVIVPVSLELTGEGHLDNAQVQVNSIRDAIEAFHADTGEWPDRQGGDVNFYEVLRGGNINADFDLFATPSTGNVSDPDVGNTDWSATTGTVGTLMNHITLDGEGYVGNGVNWNGPYLPQIFNDPWGRNYLVFVKALTQRDSVGDGTGELLVAWVISAGPNETLETDVTSPILNNNPATDLSSTADDLGAMLLILRPGTLGVSSF